MPRSTKIIFITVFTIIGLIVLGLYLFFQNKQIDPVTGNPTDYSSFNPFRRNKTPTSPIIKPDEPEEGSGGAENTEKYSRFYKITDFAVAGATFLEDTRLVDIINKREDIPEQVEIKTVLDVATKEGRIEIQNILNDIISPTPLLVADGVFGKPTVDAIKSFQKLNGLPITGKIDVNTSPYFTKTIISTIEKKEDPYEKAPAVKYVERKNGHVYRMFLDTKNKEKISNITITTIYEAFFNARADTVLLRYLSQDDSISSLVMKLQSSTKEFLPQNITDVAISSDKTRFFYLLKNDSGSTGTIRNFDDKNETVVFNSPFTEWLPQWTGNQNIYLTNKPYYKADGSVYQLNIQNKTTTKLFGKIAGLTTLVNKNGANVLYAISTATGPKLNIFDIKKYKSLDLKTYGLPDKCIWSKNDIDIYCAVPNVINGNQYPDSWYQGLVSFDDFFVKINTTTGEKTTLINSKDETPVDATNIFLSNKEDKMFFINKKDYTLWSLDL